MKTELLILLVFILFLFPEVNALDFEISDSSDPFYIPGQEGEIKDINVSNLAIYPMKITAIHSVFYWKSGRVEEDEFINNIRVEPGRYGIIGHVEFQVPPREKAGYYRYELGISYEGYIDGQWTRCTGILYYTDGDCEDRGKSMDPAYRAIRVLKEIPPEPPETVEENVTEEPPDESHKEGAIIEDLPIPETVTKEAAQEGNGEIGQDQNGEQEENMAERFIGICGPSIILLFPLVVIGTRRALKRK